MRGNARSGRVVVEGIVKRQRSSPVDACPSVQDYQQLPRLHLLYRRTTYFIRHCMPIGALRNSVRLLARSVTAARHSFRMASSMILSTPSSEPSASSTTHSLTLDGQEASAAPEDTYEPLRMQIVIRKDLKTVCTTPDSPLRASGLHFPLRAVGPRVAGRRHHRPGQSCLYRGLAQVPGRARR